MVTAMQNDQGNLTPRPQTLLIGPSVQVVWTPEQVWDTGFIDTFKDNLAFLSVERYA